MRKKAAWNIKVPNSPRWCEDVKQGNPPWTTFTIFPGSLEPLRVNSRADPSRWLEKKAELFTCSKSHMCYSIKVSSLSLSWCFNCLLPLSSTVHNPQWIGCPRAPILGQYGRHKPCTSLFIKDLREVQGLKAPKQGGASVRWEPSRGAEAARALSGNQEPSLELRTAQHTSKCGCRLKSWLPLKPMANIPLASMGAGLHARSRASHSFAVAMRANFPSKATSAARASRSRRMALLAAWEVSMGKETLIFNRNCDCPREKLA